MAQPAQDEVRNGLLRALSAEDYALLRADLEPVALNRGHTLVHANARIDYAFFLEDGLCSVLALARNAKHRIEVGIIGRDGFIGTPLLLGTDRTPNETIVQVAGSALRVRADILRRVTDQSATLRTLLLRYVQAFRVQTGHTALSNAIYTVEERLARWLLMCHDRLESDDLPLTHELIAIMLGVRRPGITVATHILEGHGMIRAKRANITILDRVKLRQAANDSYGGPEAEYSRLIAPLSREDLAGAMAEVRESQPA
jgi:CRP-like cAMP-binding protein